MLLTAFNLSVVNEVTRRFFSVTWPRAVLFSFEIDMSKRWSVAIFNHMHQAPCSRYYMSRRIFLPIFPNIDLTSGGESLTLSQDSTRLRSQQLKLEKL